MNWTFSLISGNALSCYTCEKSSEKSYEDAEKQCNIASLGKCEDATVIMGHFLSLFLFDLFLCLSFFSLSLFLSLSFSILSLFLFPSLPLPLSLYLPSSLSLSISLPLSPCLSLSLRVTRMNERTNERKNKGGK